MIQEYKSNKFDKNGIKIKTVQMKPKCAWLQIPSGQKDPVLRVGQVCFWKKNIGLVVIQF